jgi:hypothetical protein
LIYTAIIGIIVLLQQFLAVISIALKWRLYKNSADFTNQNQHSSCVEQILLNAYNPPIFIAL